jgi:hypothetical protein
VTWSTGGHIETQREAALNIPCCKPHIRWPTLIMKTDPGSPSNSTIMKKNSFHFAVLGALACASLTAGCVERRVVYVPQPQPVVSQPPPSYTPPPQETVSQPPPAPQVEVVPIAPGPGYVWTPGYWAWNGGWVWVGGNWVIRPHPHAIWVGPRWVRHGHAYVWERGHWR